MRWNQLLDGLEEFIEDQKERITDGTVVDPIEDYDPDLEKLKEIIRDATIH